MKKLITLFFIGCIAAACGDSGQASEGDFGRGPDGEVGEPQTGFLTVATSGVEYETATHRGVTDERGAFQYQEGQTVTFRIGSTRLGESRGQAQVTAFDLAGVEVVTNGWRDIRDAGSRFNRVVGVLVFLHTFDRDLDGANGIEISGDVAALFEGVEVPLDRGWRQLRTDRDFRGALNRANAAGLLEGYGVTADPVDALTELYDTLGVTPGFYDSTSREVDDDGDGLIDRVDTSEHDVRGYRIRETSHEIGSPVVVTEREIGHWAQVVLETQDISADGIVDYEFRSELNADGERTRNTTDSGADGVIERTSERSYNEFGQLLFASDDEDGDGSSDRSERWTYSSDGDWKERAVDDDGDGVVDQIKRTFFDDQGRKIGVEDDSDANGLVDRVEARRYDEAGNLVETVHDAGADGTPDTITQSGYDADGRKSWETEDSDGDGEPDSITTFIYDANGNLRLRETDRGVDGTVEGYTLNTYDERGYLTQTRTDDDGDGTIDYERSYEHDERGFATFFRQDHDGDGAPDYTESNVGVSVGWGYYFWD
jgi:hypothetical protein